MSANDIYSAGILRVACKAESLGISLPHDIWALKHPKKKSSGPLSPEIQLFRTRLGSALMDHIEDHNIRYVFWLMDAKTNTPDWHSIQCSEQSNLGCWEDLECARTKVHAIQHVYLLAEHQKINLTEEVDPDGSISFFSDGEWIATISKMVFESANELLTRKATSALKHATSIHEEKCLFSTFSPLLSTKKLQRDCTCVSRNSCNYVIHSTLNNLAASLKRAFVSLQVTLSLGHAQELLAAFFNFSSWNHMRAVETACKGIAINPAAITLRHNGKLQNLFFTDISQALAYFSTVLVKDEPYAVITLGVFGTFYFRQTLNPTSLHTAKIGNTDSGDNEVLLHTLMQADSTDLDEFIPLNQPPVVRNTKHSMMFSKSI